MTPTIRLAPLIMSVALSIGLTPASLDVMSRWETAPARIGQAISTGMEMILINVENHLKADKLSGKAGAGGGGSTPVGLRSGSLRQSISHKRDEPLSGYVGSTKGPATKYARSILGPDDTTIRPVNAKHLWIPIADNLTRGTLQQRMSPTAAFEEGKKQGQSLRVFRSKKGNLVALLTTGGTYKRDTKAGRKAGDAKGKLLFVLKEEVTIRGTDALAQAAIEELDNSRDILNRQIEGAIP